MINIYNEDCLTAMRAMKDNEFDLAIVDPPYGLNMGSYLQYKNTVYSIKDWDQKAPDKEYFDELKRVSRNQIIWGANHFISKIKNPDSSCWIIWDKNNGSSNFADAELAYTSFKTAVRIAKIHWVGSASKREDTGQKIHPTQKPVSLYTWILNRYAKEGYKILDTHLGSGSSAIACHDMNYDLTAFEIDEDYYKAAVQRLEHHKKQLKLF